MFPLRVLLGNIIGRIIESVERGEISDSFQKHFPGKEKESRNYDSLLAQRAGWYRGKSMKSYLLVVLGKTLFSPHFFVC